MALTTRGALAGAGWAAGAEGAFSGGGASQCLAATTRVSAMVVLALSHTPRKRKVASFFIAFRLYLRGPRG